MALVRNLSISSGDPNVILLTWDQPIGFNNAISDVVVTRNVTHPPMEIYNTVFPDKSTDPRGIEVFNGSTIVGLNIGTISVSGSILTDTAATFPIAPPLNGRLLRDQTSKVFKIISNTAKSITVESGTPATGKYVVLPDFPTEERSQQNFEVNIATEVGVGFIKDLVENISGSSSVVTFDEDELANMIFKDGNGDFFIIKSNTSNTIYFFETTLTPVIGVGMSLLNKFFDSSPLLYIDTFKVEQEADLRIGTGLLDNTFYYYTGFTLPTGANVAQAEFGTLGSSNSTQAGSISTKDQQFGTVLYNLWPSLYRELDQTEDLEDLMEVFGFQFNQIHSLISTYVLQNSDKVLTSALLPLSEQTGLPSVGFGIGADTLRRIARNMISCWKLKGSKEGIALFIKKITTWDITDGTADFSDAIIDFLPNVDSLRLFDSNLGSTNTRITETDPLFVAGGRFATTLPGIVIPGFFTFREFVVTLPNVALYTGSSTSFSVANGNTTMVDTLQNFGANDSLIGNFLIPNQQEVNDIFQIISNTATTITVKGVITNQGPGGTYVILSPLNTNRFIILNSLLPVYIPFGTQPGFRFV